MPGENQIYIGTSGWVYKEWANDFYRDLKPCEHFRYYATQFPTVEINATFYRLPNLSTVHDWRDKAPENFIFAVKGSRYITHIKRLNNLERSAGNFIRRIQPLKEKLGPMLWQLPPNFKPDLPRLERFLKRLPAKFSHAIEFRHPDWFADETFALLRKYNAASVSVSSLRMPLDFPSRRILFTSVFTGLRAGHGMIIRARNWSRGRGTSGNRRLREKEFMLISITT
jgi:uncharacterized protein YecE (DUF72 family)